MYNKKCCICVHHFPVLEVVTNCWKKRQSSLTACCGVLFWFAEFFFLSQWWNLRIHLGHLADALPNQHIGSSLGFIILPKDSLTCRPGESYQRPSSNKMMTLILSHSHHVNISVFGLCWKPSLARPFTRYARPCFLKEPHSSHKQTWRPTSFH